MQKSGLIAIALAAVLLIAAVPYGAAVWADSDKGRGKEVKETKQTKFEDDDDKRIQNASLGSVKASAKGIAIVKNASAAATSDATLDLSGTIFKDAGKNSRLFVNGTVKYGGEEWKVRAEGKLKVEGQGDLGKLQLHGKVYKDSARGENTFRLNAILVPTEDGKKWKMIGEQPLIAGRQVRLYALVGELQLDRAPVPQPAPQPTPGDLDHFVISTIGSQTVGSEFTFTVTAKDSSGNVKTNYTATVTLSTNSGTSPSGSAPVITPVTYTFTQADLGKKVFTARLYEAKAGTTVTVTGSGKSATSNAFEVKPAAVSSVSISPTSATVNSGSLTTFSASAKDLYGNAIANASYVWALGNQSLGTLAVSSNTASAAFTAAGVSSATSSALTVTATHGGASASSSASVTVNPV